MTFLQLTNEDTVIPSGESSFTGTLYLDSTIGQDTKLGFKYSHDIDVKVMTEQNLTTIISKNRNLKLIIVVIEGQVVCGLNINVQRTLDK